MVSKLEQKYGQQIKTILDNNNPYTQVQNLTPKKVLSPNVNTYNNQSNELKPLPKADFKPLVDNTKFFVEKGIIQPAKQVGRIALNLPSAITYSDTQVKEPQSFQVGFTEQTKENMGDYQTVASGNLDQYKSVKDSMESKYDYEFMPDNTKKAYEQVVDNIIKQDSFGKSFEEQRQSILAMYQDKPLPDFVQKRIENINSKETEYNLKLENARQNLLELAQKNASEIQGIEEKYKDSEIGQATRFSSDIMGSIVQMSPYIAVSAITGGVGGATLGSIAGTGTMYATVYTSSMSKALSEGATREQATDYAHMSALIESGTELISGGIPGAPKGLLSTGIQGKIDDVVKVVVKDGTFRKFISTGVDVFGEGFEEMAAEYLGSMALSIYTEDERTMGELNADAVKAFIMGSVTSGTLQLAKYQTLKVAEKFVAEKSVDIQSLSIEEANKLMNQIALRTGVTSQDGLSYRLEDMPKGQNGYIVNGKEIVLNRNQVEESGLIESALPHEMTHALERVKGYQDLANFVMNLKAQSVGMDLAQLQEVYQEKYNEIHEQELANGNTSHQLEIATQDKMARELVAEFIKNNIASRPYKDANGQIQYDSNGNIITYRDYNALLKLASNQPNSIEKIKKVIRSFIRKGQISEAQEFDETDKANFLIMQEYLENMDSYLSKVLENADKGLFSMEQQEGVQFDTKVLSPLSEQGVNVIRAYESENGVYNGTQEDAEKLLAYSARKGLGFNEVQTNEGTLVRDNNIQLPLDQLQDVNVNEIKDIVKQVNLSTLIPLIQQSKQSASDYINSLNIQSDNPNVARYIETMSNFIRDYNPDLRTDSLGNLTTQQQEDEFTLRDNGKLKVYYYEDNPISDNALSYGHFLTDNPLDLENPKQVYVKGNLAQANGTEFSSLNELYEELTNADVLKQYGSEALLSEIQEKLGFNGLDFDGNILVFSEEQFKDTKIKTTYSDKTLSDIKNIRFKKVGNDYLIRYKTFGGNEFTIVSDYEDTLKTFGNDIAKVVLSYANKQETNYDIVRNIVAKPNTKIKQGLFSDLRDNHDNQLTDEIVKYNQDSSIREKDGTLKVMYHGSPYKFEDFNYMFIGANGYVDGRGIYFTDKPTVAYQYTQNEGGTLYEVYLNIKKPTSKYSESITDEQLKQILIEIHNTDGNDLLNSYENVDEVGIDEAANSGIEYLRFNENDVDLIDNILYDSKIDVETGLRIVNKYTGIDGYTINNEDGNVAIAFFPEQIKSINNPNPTNDRRIQYSIELDSVKNQQIEQAKLNSTLNVNEAKAILNDGTLTTSDSVPLESVLLNPLYNQAIVYKTPTMAQKEQLQAFYLDTLARSGDTIYLELHNNDKVAYLKYPVVSDLSRIDSDIAKFYQDDSQRKEFFKNANPEAFDEQGNLKMWYHGSDQTFTIPFSNKSFGQYKFGDDTVMFFTNREDVAKTYQSYKEPETFNSETLKGSIYKGYINFKKPFIVEGNKKNWNDLNFIDIDAFFNKKQATQEEKDYLSYMVDNDILVGKKIDSEYTKSKINNAYDLFNKISNIDSEYKNKKALLSDKKIIEKFYNQVKNYDILYSKNKSVFNMMYDISNRLNNYAYYLSSKGFENQDVVELSQYIKDFGYLVNKDGNVASYQKASTNTNDIVKNVLQSNKLGLTDYDSVLFKGITDIGFNTKETTDTIEKMSQKEFKTYVIQKYSSDVLVTLKEGMFKDYTNLTPTLSPDIRYSIDDERIATRSFQESVLKTELSKKTSQSIEKDIENGAFNYVVVGDEQSIRRGLETIGNDVEQAYADIKAKFDSRLRMGKDDLVVAQLVLKKLEKSRQTDKVVDLIQNIAILGTELGQQVQALSLIKRMTPEGKLITLQKTLTKLQDSVNSTKDRNAPRVQLEIPKEYQEFFVEASARVQELEEQRVELGSKIEELTQIENEIDSLLLSNVGSEIDNLSRDLNELRALEKEEQRLLSLVENLQNKASTLSNEDIDILQEDINILKEQIITKQGSLNEIKQKQAKLSRLESQLAKVKSGESLFLDYSIEDNQTQIREYQSRINEINKQKRKFDNLESTLVKLSGINPNVVAELNAKVKVVRKAERLLKKLIKENERFTSTENVDSVLDEVKTKIAEQLPVTWKDKLDAWRYMAMLGNLRTNVRNVLGNAFVMPMTFSRDVVSVALQQFLPVEQRTRVLRASKEAEAFALNDFLTVGKERMSGTQKYDMKTDIERKRQIFKNNLLEGYREGTFKALEIGDDVFVKKHYITQMAKYLTAQKLDLNTITEEQLEMARDFAIKEAEKNTFKQASDLANALNRIERKGGFQGIAVKAIIPFKKTPINVMKMGVEYSPIGLANGIKKTLFDVKRGKVTAAQAIDTLSAGLTGTGIALLGATLYGMGFIEIGGDDDETKRVYNYKNALGRQRYSLRIGEGSYSIDWIAPAIMPFIMGASIAKALETESEESAIDILYDSALDIFDPIFELTMLQGVTDTLQSYSGSGAAWVGDVITTMGSNYINQFIPTLLGQISRTFDPIQRSTFPNAKGSLSKILEETVRKTINKTPLSFMNAPVIDVKGNPISSDENPFMRAFMNLVSPGYYKTDKTNDIDREILRLYELTENTNVIPKATPKSFTLEGESYKLGNKEFSDWGVTMGKESYELLGDLSRYDLDDESKMKVMDNIYDYAYQLAKDEYLQKQGKSNEDASYQKIVDAQLKGISITDYLIAKYKFSTMSGEGKKESFNQYLNSNGLSSDLMELVGGYKSSWTPELKNKGLKKLK